MKNILVILFLFAVTITAQEFKVTLLPDGKVMIVPNLPDKHNGTFTYFILNNETQSVDDMFYDHTKAIMYSQKNNGRILITANIY
tara:strand:+ start:360 stop:614 length:255 start_codon:yes stop_codon:yes gene_type:complete